MTWNDLDTYGTIASEMERMAKSKQTHTQKKITVFCHVLPTPFLNAGSLNLAFRRATGAVVPQLIGQLQQRTS
jgi:hypothetical protein